MDVPWDHATDTEDSRLAIEAKLRDTAELPVDVECPSTVDWKPGSDFNCIATGQSGAKDEATLRIVVSMENNEGEYTFYAE